MISNQFEQLSEQFRRCAHLPAVNNGDGVAQALGTINANLLTQNDSAAALHEDTADRTKDGDKVSG